MIRIPKSNSQRENLHPTTCQCFSTGLHQVQRNKTEGRLRAKQEDRENALGHAVSSPRARPAEDWEQDRKLYPSAKMYL